MGLLAGPGDNRAKRQRRGGACCAFRVRWRGRGTMSMAVDWCIGIWSQATICDIQAAEVELSHRGYLVVPVDDSETVLSR
jgi:hypothetical protein